MIDLYRNEGLDIYEKTHYSHGERVEDISQILSWYGVRGRRILDIGCSGGLHALEFARRGFSVIGVDIEPSAIERAKERNGELKTDAQFKVTDLTRDSLSSPGRFDLIYSLGNVLSHIDKEKMAGVLRKIGACLADGGVFLFDLLMKGNPFRSEIRDETHRILWTKSLEEEPGKISMDGAFLDFGVVQHFEVWSYTVEEVLKLISASGYVTQGICEHLDFAERTEHGEDPFCLNFRARLKEEK
jgi:SAM-dependent methyltransferase